MLKRVFHQDSLLLPTAVLPLPHSHQFRVLDLCAGTLAWSIEFASLPEVVSWKSLQGQESIQIYASDITATQFPAPETLDSLGIQTFIQDVTLEFPKSFHHSFDLVHMRLLVMALSQEGWRRAIENVVKILSEWLSYALRAIPEYPGRTRR